MKLTDGERVRTETAEERALDALDTEQPNAPNMIANAIWPNHGMTAQGAGGAASHILKRLEKQGRARHTTVYRHGRPIAWGWIKC